MLAILGVAVWKAAAIVLRRNAAGYLQFKTQQDVRERLIEHQLGLSLSWFGRQSMGDLLAIADNDTRQATGVLAPFPYASGVSLLIVGTVVLMFFIDFWVGLVALVGMALVVFVEVRAAVTVYPAWEGIQKQMGKVTGVAHESFDGALTVKALGREHEVARLRTESEDLAGASPRPTRCGRRTGDHHHPDAGHPLAVLVVGAVRSTPAHARRRCRLRALSAGPPRLPGPAHRLRPLRRRLAPPSAGSRRSWRWTRWWSTAPRRRRRIRRAGRR